MKIQPRTIGYKNDYFLCECQIQGKSNSPTSIPHSTGIAISDKYVTLPFYRKDWNRIQEMLEIIVNESANMTIQFLSVRN